jgi:hypothetical protein
MTGRLPARQQASNSLHMFSSARAASSPHWPIKCDIDELIVGSAGSISLECPHCGAAIAGPLILLLSRDLLRERDSLLSGRGARDMFLILRRVFLRIAGAKKRRFPMLGLCTLYCKSIKSSAPGSTSRVG